jgi:hypothetical protein
MFLTQPVACIMQDGEAGAGASTRPRVDPAVIAEERAALQKLMSDYYQLDYEDNVGGMKTRFRYKPVSGGWGLGCGAGAGQVVPSCCIVKLVRSSSEWGR